MRLTTSDGHDHDGSGHGGHDPVIEEWVTCQFRVACHFYSWSKILVSASAKILPCAQLHPIRLVGRTFQALIM